jgi:hypothetical protein
MPRQGRGDQGRRIMQRGHACLDQRVEIDASGFAGAVDGGKYAVVVISDWNRNANNSVFQLIPDQGVTVMVHAVEDAAKFVCSNTPRISTRLQLEWLLLWWPRWLKSWLCALNGLGRGSDIQQQYIWWPLRWGATRI